MTVPEFDVLYDDLTKEELMFLSLKYERCDYSITFNEFGGACIIYEDPTEYPALFVVDYKSTQLAGIFTCASKVNFAFVQMEYKRNE